jgi:cell wall-associated NlpC family hydrolase
MSRRRHRLLPVFALSAVVVLTAAAPLIAGGGVGTAAAATLEPLPPYEPKPAATVGELAAANALRMVGVPYRWGGASPDVGFDCSGLVYWAYGEVGVTVPHSSYALYSFGKRVTRSRLKAGDVLFFDGLGHVGVYLGYGRMVHAPETGRSVEVVRLARSHYGDRIVGARRIAAA